MNHPSSLYPQGKAAIFNGHGQPFEYSTHHVPALKPGEVLVKVLYTTICGSDVHTYCGRRQEPPHVVLGHEITGDIVAIESSHSGLDFKGQGITAGDRITWSIFSVPAGVVAPRQDMPQKSDQLFKYGHVLAEGEDIFNGGLADYCILRSNTALVKIDKNIPLKVAATISCAHATVTGALRIAGNIENRKVLVLGAGLLGLSCLAQCKEAGASWIGIVDHDLSRLPWGEKFGADKAYSLPVIDNIFPWPEVDIVFDMTGHPEAMKTGLDALALGGIAVWIGAVYPAAPVAVDAQKIVRKLLQIRGLHNYNYEDFLNAVSFIENNYQNYPFEDLVEKEFVLSEVEQAFAWANEKRPVRVGVSI